MPKIDMNAYNEATPMGDANNLLPGAYVGRITAVRTAGKDKSGNYIDYVNEKQYVKLIFDIAEGEYAGYFSDDFWKPEDKDFGHCIYLSWKNFGALKGNMQSLEESNPGFDPMAAFTADAWQMFVGRMIGLVIGDEEYESNDGEVKTRLRLPNLKPVQDVREGKCKVPKTKRLEGSKDSSKPAEQSAPVDIDDIPF